jgi:hypothetical protein
MSWRGVASWAFAATLGVAASGALAEPGVDQDTHILAALARPPPERPAQPAVRDQARLLLFSSTDLWRDGGFAHGGVVIAPGGLDRDGPLIKLMFGGGLYRYTSGALGNAAVTGQILAAAILPGWRFVRDNVVVTVFLGYDFQRHQLTPDDPSAGLRGSYVGARTGFELWYQPTASTMVAADAAFSTIGPSYNVRLATGLRAFDAFFVGPEVQAFDADDNYRQFRVGMHVTGLRTGEFEWSAGAGWAQDTDDRGGAYGKLGIFTRR